MRIKASGCILCTVFFLFAAVLNASSEGNSLTGFTGEINSEGINIRSDSTTQSQIICQIKKGASVEVISELYDWYKIRLPKIAPSYVKKDLLECVNYENTAGPGNSMQISTNKRCLSAKASKDRINVRLKPNEPSVILGRLDKNEVANIVKETGDWYRIEPIQNSFGWINKKFVSKRSLR